MALILYLVFFLAGAAALLFETLWFHQLGLVLGNSVWASSLVLAGFMGGLGLGNGLAGRFGHRVRRRVRLYAGLELAIGATSAGNSDPCAGTSCCAGVSTRAWVVDPTFTQAIPSAVASSPAIPAITTFLMLSQHRMSSDHSVCTVLWRVVCSN